MKDIPLRRDPVPGLIWNYAVQILYNPILALVKASVLIFLLRLFGQKDGVRRVIYILMVVNLAQMFGVFFAIIFQCSPIAFNWDLSIRGGHCIEQRVLYTSTAAFTILTDLLVLAVPLWIFTSLKIPRKTKFALLFVFLLGFMCVPSPPPPPLNSTQPTNSHLASPSLRLSGLSSSCRACSGSSPRRTRPSTSAS